MTEPDRLRHCELHARHQVAQHWPGGEAGNDAYNASGRKKAHAILPHSRERHQGGTEREHDQQHVDRARKHAHLRVVFAREQVVIDVEAEATKIKLGGDMQHYDRRPADEANHGDRHHAGEQSRSFRRQRCDRDGNHHHQNEQCRLCEPTRLGKDGEHERISSGYGSTDELARPAMEHERKKHRDRED